jgi:hypothetical protein
VDVDAVSTAGERHGCVAGTLAIVLEVPKNFLRDP